MPFMKQPSSVLVSSISILEITLLVQENQLRLTIPLHEWLNLVERLPVLWFVPVDSPIASQ